MNNGCVENRVGSPLPPSLLAARGFYGKLGFSLLATDVPYSVACLSKYRKPEKVLVVGIVLLDYSGAR